MAIQFVGGATSAKLGATSGNTTIALNSGLTGGIASAVAAGDLVIAVFATGSTADRTLVITADANYTQIGTEQYSNSTFDTNLRVAYKFMGTTPDTSVTFGPTGNNADAGAMAVYVFRGVDQTTPLDGVTPAVASATNTVLVNPPSITPATSGAFPVFVGAGAHSGGVDTYSSSDLTAFRSVGGLDDTNDVSIGIGHIDNWTSGAVDPAAWTHTQADLTTFSNASKAFVLRPIQPKAALALITATGIVSAAASKIAIRSATLTATGAIAAVAGATRPRSAIFSAVATIVAAASNLKSRTVALIASGIFAAAAVRIPGASAVLAATATVSVAARRQGNASAVLAAVATITATGSQVASARYARVSYITLFGASVAGTKNAVANITAHAAVTITAYASRVVSAVLTATASLSNSATRTAHRTAAFIAYGALSAQPNPLRPCSAALISVGVVTATSLRYSNVAATLASSATVTVTGTLVGGVTVNRSALLEAFASLTSQPNPIRIRSATLAATATLSASGYNIEITSASIFATGSLSSVATRIGIRSADLISLSALSADTAAFRPRAAVLTASGSISVLINAYRPRSASLTISATLTSVPTKLSPVTWGYGSSVQRITNEYAIPVVNPSDPFKVIVNENTEDYIRCIRLANSIVKAKSFAPVKVNKKTTALKINPMYDVVKRTETEAIKLSLYN
jgi:hypothetical protein